MPRTHVSRHKYTSEQSKMHARQSEAVRAPLTLILSTRAMLVLKAWQMTPAQGGHCFPSTEGAMETQNVQVTVSGLTTRRSRLRTTVQCWRLTGGS